MQRHDQSGPNARPILIVVDDAYSRGLLISLLRSKGYPVAAAADGEEALAVAWEEHPCLILLDLMPGMDGIAFRTAQLSSSKLANTPVILMSALDDPWQGARRIGRMAALREPHVDELLEQVALYL